MGPITILFVAANPFLIDYDVEFDEELSRIRRALRSARYGSRIRLIEVLNLEFSELGTQIDRYKPDIIHLAVPALPDVGLFFQELVRDKPSAQAALKGNPVRTAATAGPQENSIAELFRDINVKIKVLVCNTAVSQTAAQQIAEHVGAIIGMPSLVHNEQCIAFAEAFYAAVGEGAGIREAVRAGSFKMGEAANLLQPSQRDHYLPIKPYLLTHPGENVPILDLPNASSVGAESSASVRVLYLCGATTLVRHGRPLDLAREIRWIEEKLRQSRYRHRVNLHTEWAVRSHELQDHLLFHDPHILVFSGHAGEDGVFLWNRDGEIKSVPAAVLSGALRVAGKNVRCVILNGCRTATLAKELTNIIDYAIGMTDYIEDRVAMVFAEGFFRAIAYEKTVEDAFEMAIESIREHETGEPGIKWSGIPKLFRKAQAENMQAEPHPLADKIIGNDTGEFPKTSAVKPDLPRRPTIASVRKLLYELLPTSHDFDAFCMDSFSPRVFRRFSDAADRQAKHNLLLTLVETSDVVEALRKQFSEKFDRWESAIEWETE